MRSAKLGKRYSETTRKKQSLLKVGKKRSEETKAKIRSSMLVNKMSAKKS
jgi:NUMOD3 motif